MGPYKKKMPWYLNIYVTLKKKEKKKLDGRLKCLRFLCEILIFDQLMAWGMLQNFYMDDMILGKKYII